MNCPACRSPEVVDGKIIADGSETGSAESFFPSGIRLLTLRRSVRLLGSQSFKACTQCGHVWNRLDATGLRELIQTGGTEQLKKSLRERRVRAELRAASEVKK